MLGCGSAGKCYFLSLLVNQLAPWIQCVFHGTNKVHRPNEAVKQLGFAFLCYLKQGARSLSVFLQLRQILLQVTIAFVLKIFFSDKKKVLDAFDRHCWDAACCCKTFPQKSSEAFMNLKKSALRRTKKTSPACWNRVL